MKKLLSYFTVFDFEMRLGFGYAAETNKISAASRWLADFSVRFGYRL